MILDASVSFIRCCRFCEALSFNKVKRRTGACLTKNKKNIVCGICWFEKITLGAGAGGCGIVWFDFVEFDVLGLNFLVLIFLV
jgi:hypothetical protein